MQRESGSPFSTLIYARKKSKRKIRGIIGTDGRQQK